jgi:hypothetical protein
MHRRGVFVAVAAAVLLAANSAAAGPPVLPSGPLQGNWSCECTSLFRAGLPPFTTSTFHITQFGSVIQGNNTPTGGDPACSFTGTYSAGMILANLTCGAPRNTSGYVAGKLAANGQSFDTLWLDSQGLYRVRGTKLP